jgi:hypothetical protein
MPKLKWTVTILIFGTVLFGVMGCSAVASLFPTPTLVPTATPVPTMTPVPTPTPTTARIEGMFYPPANVNLTMFPSKKESGLANISTTAGTDGKFIFADVKPGKYDVSLLVWFQGRSSVPCRNIKFNLTGTNRTLPSSGKGGATMTMTGHMDNGDAAVMFSSGNEVEVMAGDLLELEVQCN